MIAKQGQQTDREDAREGLARGPRKDIRINTGNRLPRLAVVHILTMFLYFYLVAVRISPYLCLWRHLSIG